MVYFKFGRRTITTSGRLSRLLDGGHNNGITPLRPQNDDGETISIGEERIFIGRRIESPMEPGLIFMPYLPIIENQMTMIIKNPFKFGK
jgi:hypothetical protein